MGPEATEEGSSPGTSEMISVTTRAGNAAAASRPPLIAEMLAHAIHLANGRAAGEQRPVHRLLVRQRQPGGGKTEQRRAAARNQGNDQVVLRQVLDHAENTFRRLLASQVGDGMRRLHDLDLSGIARRDRSA